MDSSVEDEHIDIVLRDSEPVAIRTIILAALTYRAYLELDDDREDDIGADDDRLEILDWMRDEDLVDHLEPAELDILGAPVGTLNEDGARSTTWSAEALAPLCWALGLISELSPPHQPVDAAAWLNLVPSPGSPASEFIGQATLRDEYMIATARESAELWYWRATVQELLDTVSPADRNDLVTAILETTEEAAALDTLPPSARGDFPVNGEPYALAPDHETLATIAEWRLRALNWLCGFGETWETVPLDF